MTTVVRLPIPRHFTWTQETVELFLVYLAHEAVMVNEADLWSGLWDERRVIYDIH